MNSHQIRIAPFLWEEMKGHVTREAPLEACGLIAGQNGQATRAYIIENELKSPVKFRMNALEQLAAFEDMEKNGLELISIYHSHPNGPSIPSPTDIEEAHYEVTYLIWYFNGSTWQARVFLLDKSHAAEIPFHISDM